MFRSPVDGVVAARRAVILIVVLALLALFAIVGLSFVLYANAAAKASQLAREGENQNSLDVDPQLLLSYFLGQLIYDTDDRTGIYSALRGHSLARTMYGLNYDPVTNVLLPNNVPFNGTGRLHTLAGAPKLGTFNNNLRGTGIDDYYLINYTYHPADGFLRDPERLGATQRSTNAYRPYRTDPTDPNVVPGPYRGGFNAPYTYPDLNNMFLAAVKADSTVLLPSFHRPWLFGSLTNTTGNANWSNAEGKYLTLRPRPIDMDPDRFPYPEDEGGDVKNLVGSPGYYDPLFTHAYCNNDSIWMDLGFPVMLGPDGRKFKPLFAPLIVDLDNRVNLNVHGNIRGYDGSKDRWLHFSNHGLGPWEVNLGRVLSARDPSDPTDDDPQNPKEWTKLFTGRVGPSVPGRYGSNGPDSVPIPHSTLPGNLAPAMTAPPFFSRLAFDASNDDWNGSAPTGISSKVILPRNDKKTFTCFPVYQNGYAGTGMERLNHPLLFNVFQPAPNDRAFTLSNMEALLRYGETGSPALTSDLFRSCPVNFSNQKARGLVTTHSFDYDRPGAFPWAPRYTAGTYILDGDGDDDDEANYPTGKPIPYDVTRLDQGEYGPDGRSSAAALGRIDLNRPLPPYRLPTDPPGRITNLNQFKLAQEARVQLARDIYQRLRLVTTGDISEPPTAKPKTPEFRALRWLAQLAVNIVDYIDFDGNSESYMTPFNWYPKAYDATHPNGDWVFGTELPHVVLNEAYAEVRNDPIDKVTTNKKATLKYDLNFWIELHNPFFADPHLPDSLKPTDPQYYGAARLQMPESAPKKGDEYPIYELVVVRTPLFVSKIPMTDPDNTLGDPPIPTSVKLVVNNYSSATGTPNVDTNVILATDGSYQVGTGSQPKVGSNEQGFYVLGPNADFPGTQPALATLRIAHKVVGASTSDLTYKIPLNHRLVDTTPHAILLRRLACPDLPPQSNPAKENYNPHITIDYIHNLFVNDGVEYDQDGKRAVFIKAVDRKSYGRKQPYAAARLFASPAVAGQPHHTFFRHNGTQNPFTTPTTSFKYPFDWLNHADRQLISPMELLHVSRFKPHELTQEFVSYGVFTEFPFQHRVGPVVSQNRARIYRVFEFLETANRTLGASIGGRVSGKININTVWDSETLKALCDPQSSNNFGPGYDVNQLFAKISESRAPGDTTTTLPRPPVPVPRGTFSKQDRPFRGMATAYSAASANENLSPSGSGIEDTLLRLDSTKKSLLFGIPVASSSIPPPFQTEELITKLFNNVTTRSNVFAVWLTVGFFEVVDDQARPVRLGAEIGRAENRHIRHRMFAIVDRTNIRRSVQTPVFISAKSAAEVSPLAVPPHPTPYPNVDAPAQTITVDALSGTYEGTPWAIREGTTLLVDVGVDDQVTPTTAQNATLPHQEMVTVTHVDLPRSSFTAKFRYPHRTGFLINLAGGTPTPAHYSMPGNPGPQPSYDPRQDTAVARYVSIIE
jgi:hypothetical protein